MTSPTPDQPPSKNGKMFSSQQIILISILGVILLAVLVASIVVLTKPPSEPLEEIQEPAEAVISTVPVPTLPATLTPTSTLRSTFTPKATRTQTLSPTSTNTPFPTLIPSLTPAFPGEHNDQYELVHWTPDLATDLIDLLEVYPETLSGFSRGADDQGYYEAFQYALFSQQEALHRFQTAPQANDWLWQLAYNLARTGDPSAGETYANLITQELNSGQVAFEEINRWSMNRSPQVSIEVIPLESSSSDLSSNLVKVSAGENGSSYFWLVEKPNGYTSFSLTSDFNFVQPSKIDHMVINQMGTNNEVVGIFPATVYDSLNYITPRIFSLDQQPPVKLFFDSTIPPAIGPEFTNDWQPVEAGNGEAVLQFEDVIFAACPVTVNHKYSWTGSVLSFMQASYEIDPDLDLLSYCEPVINHAFNVWGVEPTIQLMETLLPVWPPEITTTGGEYPEDALDEWQFRLSLYHGLIANRLESITYAETIISNPASPDSSWIVPAVEFRDAYQEQRDIYRACTPFAHCNPRLAFKSLSATLAEQDFPEMIQILESAGVSIRSFGFFDFDNDGNSERWIVIRHFPGSPLELWIMKPHENGIFAIFVGPIEFDSPQLSYLEPISEPPVILLDPDKTFQLLKPDPVGDPVVVMTEQEVIFASDRMALELDALEVTLFTGGDPAFVQQELLVLRASPHFTCSFQLCPRYLYLLGLASELSNDERAAVDSYLELWRNFIDNPYATMARFKLISNVTPAPTFTPASTATPSPTITLSPTPLGTSGTPSPTLTETLPGYPPPVDPTLSTPPGYPAP